MLHALILDRPCGLLVLWQALLHSLVVWLFSVAAACNGADVMLLTNVWADHCESPVEIRLVLIHLFWMRMLLVELRLVRLVQNWVANIHWALLLHHRLSAVIIIDLILLELLISGLTSIQWTVKCTIIFKLGYLIHSLIFHVVHQNKAHIQPEIYALASIEALHGIVVDSIPDVLDNCIVLLGRPSVWSAPRYFEITILEHWRHRRRRKHVGCSRTVVLHILQGWHIPLLYVLKAFVYVDGSSFENRVVVLVCVELLRLLEQSWETKRWELIRDGRVVSWHCLLIFVLDKFSLRPGYLVDLIVAYHVRHWEDSIELVRRQCIFPAWILLQWLV